MQSKIAQALRSPFEPIAFLWSDDKPEGALQLGDGKSGCAMALLAHATRGNVGVVDQQSFGCPGGGTGLGFGNALASWPGGVECHERLLSTGNDRTPEGRALGDALAQELSPRRLEEFRFGERFVKDADIARRHLEALPKMHPPAPFIVIKPLRLVDERRERPVSVVFLVDPDRLSALTLLANYMSEHNENVFLPQASGCQSIGLYAFNEAASERPRAVVGLTDISARLLIRRQLGRSVMSFAIPYSLFLQMEANVEGSFLERPTWKDLLALADEGAERAS